MDVERDKQVCGSCNYWKGLRELVHDTIFRVQASARGRCDRLNKAKPPHGGCDQWTITEVNKNE